MPADELRALLYPLSPEELLARYWEREALYIPGSPDKFRRLFDRERFFRAAERGESQGASIRVSFDNESDPGSAGTHAPIRAAEIESYLSRGASVCVDPIEVGDPDLARFAARVAAQLHYTGATSVKAYFSSDRCGFNTHFDRGIATTLQIEGKKRWRFGTAPAVPFPRGNALLGPDRRIRYVDRLASSLEPWERAGGVEPEELREVVLEPGDVLCLPAGTWHSAKAVGHSLALNLSFQAVPCLPFLTSLLEPLLMARPEWRRSLPAALGDAGDGMPPEVAGFLAERLAELAALLGELDSAGARAHDNWRKRIAGRAAPASKSSAAFTLDPPPPQPPAAASADAQTGELSGKLTCTICVRDLTAAVSWYTSVLGFTVLYRVDAFSWCELATPISGVSVGLSEVPEVGTHGGALLDFGVRDLDATRRRMEESGVVFDGPTQVIQRFVKLAPFFDPDGNRLLLSQTL